MGREIPVNSGWRDHVVATKTMRGQVHLLLSIRKTTCDDCGTGIRFDTVWCSPMDTPHVLSWCSTCFDANCICTELNEELTQLSTTLLDRHTRGLDVPYWNSARPAIEDLERRGLL